MARQLRLLDLFCKAGGCSMGYSRAGFEVFGVDHEPQPHYPFDFFKADAFMFLRNMMDDQPEENGGMSINDFDAIHASPPCQAYSQARNMWHGRLLADRHPDLIGKTREMLKRAGKPFVIENVVGAPLVNPTLLCGSMFGLGVKRHRLFETSFWIWGKKMECEPGHPNFTVSVFGNGALSKTPAVGWTDGTGNFMQSRTHIKHADAKKAMGIDWMVRDELSQAVPPAYTEWIGRHLAAECLK